MFVSDIIIESEGLGTFLKNSEKFLLKQVKN